MTVNIPRDEAAVDAAYAPVRAALAELLRRVRAGEDPGSIQIDFSTLPPREPDPEWDDWERAVLERTFED